VGQAGRWSVAALVTLAAGAAATWVSGVFLFTRLLPSPDARWPVAVTIGAAVVAFVGLWAQSRATGSGGQVSVKQLAPSTAERRVEWHPGARWPRQPSRNAHHAA
jgi:hypothetical protein